MDSALNTNSHTLSTDISGVASLLGTENLSLSLSDPRHLSLSDSEPVRTLFVSGLPADVKNRELYNLFRTFDGFQSSTISYTGERKMPVSFVVFSNQDYALAAREVLQGINFDPEVPTPLRIELAKSNSKSKLRKKEPIASVVSVRSRKPDSFNSSLQVQQEMYSEHGNSFSYFPERSSAQYLSQVPLHESDRRSSPPRSPAQHSPCSTLFVGNISPVTTETDLQKMFSQFPGFEKLKVSQKGDSLMCFIDFSNVTSSNSAMNTLQTLSANLPAADGRRIRIEFARSKMVQIPTWS